MADAKKDDGTPKETREKLKTYDLAAMQFCNSMGKSSVATCPLATLWQVTANGNKGAKYFCELCSEDPCRQQVAVSRLCEVLSQLCTELEMPVYKKYIDKPLYDPAMKELKELKNHLPILQCKDAITPEGENDTMTVGKLNYRMNTTIAEARDEATVKNAAEALYAWLKKDKSTLRELIAFLSGGGLFYVTQCHEKVHRAYLSEKRPTKDDFTAMNKKRLCTASKKPDVEGSSDLPS